VVRTREPFRVEDSLHGLAFSLRTPFKTWPMIDGWHTYNMQDPTQPVQRDGTRDIMAAVAQIIGHGTDTGGFPNGIYALFWPHFMLKDSRIPALIQMIAEIARSCSESTKRVVLIVPPSFNVPPELQESVSLLDFDLPNREEMAESYARIYQSLDGPEHRPVRWTVSSLLSSA